MKNNEKIRNELQESFDCAFLCQDCLQLGKLYSRLKILNRTNVNYSKECVDISDLTENVALASDILLREMGKSVIFCGNDISPVLGNRQFLTKAILEIVSNACIFGDSSLIVVKTAECREHAYIEIQSLGNFSFCGGGFDYVNSVVKEFGGSFFTVHEKETTTFTLTLRPLKKCKKIISVPDGKSQISVAENPTFLDLVSDRLSPVFVEIYGV